MRSSCRGDEVARKGERRREEKEAECVDGRLKQQALKGLTGLKDSTMPGIIQ